MEYAGAIFLSRLLTPTGPSGGREKKRAAVAAGGDDDAGLVCGAVEGGHAVISGPFVCCETRIK